MEKLRDNNGRVVPTKLGKVFTAAQTLKSCVQTIHDISSKVVQYEDVIGLELDVGFLVKHCQAMVDHIDRVMPAVLCPCRGDDFNCICGAKGWLTSQQRGELVQQGKYPAELPPLKPDTQIHPRRKSLRKLKGVALPLCTEVRLQKRLKNPSE